VMPSTTRAVFLSYRREETRHIAGRLADRLTERLGSTQVFMDVDTIEPGDDFAAAIAREVASCDVLIALIGPTWSTITDRRGRRRLDDPDDFVVLEIRTALEREIHVIPVLVDGAVMPDRDDISEGLKGLARRNAVRLDHETFRSDVIPLLDAVERILPTSRSEPSDAPRSPWNVPTIDGEAVERSELIQAVTHLVLNHARTVGVTTALHGAGGFGKTTLAKQVCLRPEVRDSFPGGLLWLTVGEESQGAQLAAAIGDLCRELGDERLSMSDPEQAGFRLGELLDGRPPTLLVVDDVWHADQLMPFLQRGDTCTRLVTTRIRSLLPNDAVPILVDQMRIGEATDLLQRGLSQPLPVELSNLLLRLTGLWPLLLGLVHGRIVRAGRQGIKPSSEARLIAAELSAGGPAALDLTFETQRERAVRLTVEASLKPLSRQQRERYIELGVFAEDVDIPQEMVHLLWQHTGRMSSIDADRLCRDLAELSLISMSTYQTSRAVHLHDVLRSYLRGPADQEHQHRLTVLNSHLVNAARTLLPKVADKLVDAADDRLGVAPMPETDAWWRLPKSADYLWRHLTWHLVEADQRDKLASLVYDLRWVEARLRRDGVVAVASDLSFDDGPTARALLEALGQSAHLLLSTEPPEALADVLLSRLDGTPYLDAITADYAEHLPARPRLSNAWPPADKADPALRGVLGGHTGEVNSAATAKGAGWLVSTGDDGTIRIWDDATYAPRAVLTHETGRVLCGAVAPDGAWLASGGEDGTIQIWDPSIPVPTALLAGHTDWVRGLTVAPDGKWLASGGDDGIVQVWDVTTQTCRATITNGAGRVRGLAVAPDGAWLASAGDDGKVRIWNVETRVLEATLTGHSGQVWAIAAAPDGTWVVSAGDDATVRIWDVATHTCVATLTGHSGRVRGLAIAPNGTRLVSIGDDATVRIWNPRTHTLVATLLGHTGRVLGVAYSADGTRLISTGGDGTVRIWNPEAGRLHDEYIGAVWHAAVTSDSRSVASAGFDGVVRLWDVKERTSVIYGRHAGPVLGVAVSAERGQFASSGGDGKIKVWDIASRVLVATLSHPGGWVYAVDYSPDGSWLVSVGADETAKIWDSGTHELKAILRGHQGDVNAVAVAPSGDWIVTAGDDATVRIWDATTATATATLAGPASPLLGVTIAADGCWIASGGADGMVRMWDIRTRSSIFAVSAHRGPVWAVAAAKDGKWLASAGVDGTIRIWEVTTGRCQAMMRVDAALFGCVWMPNGKCLAAVGSRGVYLFHFASPTQLSEQDQGFV
jgi:WD40 repeat protein